MIKVSTNARAAWRRCLAIGGCGDHRGLLPVDPIHHQYRDCQPIGSDHWGGSGMRHGGRDRGARVERLFEHMDANADGVISAEEISARRTEAFQAFDGNGDGQLSVQEIAAAQEEIRERMMQGRALRGVARADRFVEADANGDGVLSESEFAAVRPRMMSRVDRNGDGDISQEEAEAMRGSRRGSDRAE